MRGTVRSRVWFANEMLWFTMYFVFICDFFGFLFAPCSVFVLLSKKYRRYSWGTVRSLDVFSNEIWWNSCFHAFRLVFLVFHWFPLVFIVFHVFSLHFHCRRLVFYWFSLDSNVFSLLFIDFHWSYWFLLIFIVPDPQNVSPHTWRHFCDFF